MARCDFYAAIYVEMKCRKINFFGASKSNVDDICARIRKAFCQRFLEGGLVGRTSLPTTTCLALKYSAYARPIR